MAIVKSSRVMSKQLSSRGFAECLSSPVGQGNRYITADMGSRVLSRVRGSNEERFRRSNGPSTPSLRSSRGTNSLGAERAEVRCAERIGLRHWVFVQLERRLPAELGLPHRQGSPMEPVFQPPFRWDRIAAARGNAVGVSFFWRRPGTEWVLKREQVLRVVGFPGSVCVCVCL